jgi:hypothetical protein
VDFTSQGFYLLGLDFSTPSLLGLVSFGVFAVGCFRHVFSVVVDFTSKVFSILSLDCFLLLPPLLGLVSLQFQCRTGCHSAWTNIFVRTGFWVACFGSTTLAWLSSLFWNNFITALIAIVASSSWIGVSTVRFWIPLGVFSVFFSFWRSFFVWRFVQFG